MKLNINNTRFTSSSRQTSLVFDSKLPDYFIIHIDSPNFPEYFLIQSLFLPSRWSYIFQGNSVVGFNSEGNICIFFFAMSVVAQFDVR
jgi:hypothetical protein